MSLCRFGKIEGFPIIAFAVARKFMPYRRRDNICGNTLSICPSKRRQKASSMRTLFRSVRRTVALSFLMSWKFMRTQRESIVIEYNRHVNFWFGISSQGRLFSKLIAVYHSSDFNSLSKFISRAATTVGKLQTTMTIVVDCVWDNFGRRIWASSNNRGFSPRRMTIAQLQAWGRVICD